MKLILLLAISASTIFCKQVVSDASGVRWKIESVSLTPETIASGQLPDGSEPNRLTIGISDSELDAHFVLSSDVRLSEISSSFIRHNKLAVLGGAGRASAVVIFDLIAQRLSDWYICIEPKRISANWIAYIEWYPRLFGGDNPREAVLLYDLDESPIQNRLGNAGRLSIPADVSAGPTEVGIPVYPEFNVQQKSYRNVVANSIDEETILSDLSFLLLPHERLVFASEKGQDYLSSQDSLIVVDLSRGVHDPNIKTLGIPKDQLRKPGQNPNSVKITNIEPASETAVRLLVLEGEYGVSSIVVNVP